MKNLLSENKLVLMEMAIVEILRRAEDVELHETLVNAPLVYDEKGSLALEKIYQTYIDLSIKADLPILLCTPTWRANKARVFNSDINHAVNIDSAHLLNKIKKDNPNYSHKIKIGGLIGCKNDCYLPQEGLSAIDAQEFHSWQINELIEGGVDFLIAETIPNVQEALGIAKAMQKAGVEYIISFVISKDGYILDGTSLLDAIELIDSQTTLKPLGYMVNCSYPTFLCAKKQPKELFDRLIGFLANASSLDHCELENADNLESESVSDWGDEMIKLYKEYGVKVLGGCCGTTNEHL
ncbi:homocysteine S-methyltransferase family protein [Sulfurimonas sp.]|uniref:homocysteine S-methyltransferase family protein n=1 Tax=Sulfurimonas sp. TaxID=2022749 RepID=UPI0025DB683B|nr:homocysteine S-methyltransferase family protein [Sulfurimonas sp.]